MSAAEFVRGARALKGTKWRHRARTSLAVDCIGLVVVSAATAGRVITDHRAYGREAWRQELLEACQAEFGPPIKGPPHAGDVPLIRWGNVAHMGILADHPDGGLSIIHAHNLHGVIEQTYSGPIKLGTVAIFRPFPEAA